MTFLQSIIMGLVQGITEFLPISSSGHLVLIKHLLQVEMDTNIVFEVMLHIGTLIAVFIAFWADIKRLFFELIRIIQDVWANLIILIHNQKDDDAKRYHKVLQNNYRKFIVLIVVSTIPTAVIGLMLQNVVVQASNSLLAAGSGMLITSVFLLVVDYTQDGRKIPMDVNYGMAIIIGVCQGIAVLPGISRSGITITACLLLGFNKKFAIKYSFIMSIPAIIGAMILEISSSSQAGISVLTGLYYVIGMVIAAAVGFVCIRAMLKLVQKRRFKFFSGYCLVMGIIIIIYNFVLK